MIIISTPEHSQPVYLCRFMVRSLIWLARGFSSQCGVSLTHLFIRIDMPITFQGYDQADLPTRSLFALSLALQSPNKPTLLRPLFTQMSKSGTGIFNLFSIAYSNWPRLRCRLTLSGWTDLTETLDFRRMGLSPIFSLLMPTFSLLWPQHLSSRSSSYLSKNAPLPLVQNKSWTKP